MMDPEGLAIPDVQLIIDSTKAEVIDYFKTINQKLEQIILDEGCRIGIFILTIGYRINNDLLRSLKAPRSDENTLHDYQLTCEGEAVSIF